MAETDDACLETFTLKRARTAQELWKHPAVCALLTDLERNIVRPLGVIKK